MSTEHKLTIERGLEPPKLRRQSRHNYCPKCRTNGEHCYDIFCTRCGTTLLFGLDKDKAMMRKSPVGKL